MTLAKRIIPCLDVDNGRVVKGVHFADVKDAGDPVELAKKYSEQGADELVFLDITASQQGRDTMKNVVRKVAMVIDIPFTVGGGIKKLEDARGILLSGADKVSINTAAVKGPELITQLMEIFGKQCVVVAIDAKRRYCEGVECKGKHTFRDKKGRRYWFEVMIYGGKEGTGLDAIAWAREVEKRGAGEILLTSIDADGTENGYDIELTRAICKASTIPVIASGGCGSPRHMREVFEKADVDAALAASIFHYEKSTVDKVKKYLKRSGVRTRI
ncbi:imidazoleglycerol phosphate synthase, cyclase subunit [Candidatus Nitrososphaera evergladensis SR1]|uniref:Imidazole glycerol phosphate synthase subunit HisF n=1 Tax=Candidatus Nitrososphaera evergladensis SR1 TaxID=1459636 RepID=A0A075MVR7_9ARCH|nr:imidazole glycerol phosphate synthase subunit HisF [Candidatus Nitrososphaera evergladensis]AIF85233.1 imidazoleglycerol phosphate synthase, cyclase subunit [Candidatus Nitrososphaera evergladensis SR1]